MLLIFAFNLFSFPDLWSSLALNYYSGSKMASTTTIATQRSWCVCECSVWRMKLASKIVKMSRKVTRTKCQAILCRGFWTQQNMLYESVLTNCSRPEFVASLVLFLFLSLFTFFSHRNFPTWLFTRISTLPRLLFMLLDRAEVVLALT